jgi:ABC-2 type transport system permease protein
MNLLRAEFFKLRSTSLWWIMLIILLPLWAASLGLNWLTLYGLKQANQAMGSAEAAATLYTTGQYCGVLLIMLLGALLVTNEFFHLTATTTFLVTPKREKVVYAKFGAVMVAALGAWLLTTALNLIAAPIVLGQENYDAQLGTGGVWRAIGLNAIAFLLWSVLGVGFGVLIRNQIATTVVLSVAYVIGTTVVGVVFNLLASTVAEWIGKLQVLVPTSASDLMISGTELPGNPPRWLGAVVLIGYALVAGVIGTLLTKSRDIS